MLDNISLHHIGVVVNKISNDSANFQNFIEASDISLPFDDVFQKVRVAFLDVYPIKIEFIEPLNIDSPISNFLNFGGGIHHIAFETDSLEKTKEKLCDKGARPLQERPTIGFGGREIFFIFFPNSGIKIVELIGSTPKNKDFS